MTNLAAAALIIVPIGLLVYWWWIVLVNFSQDGNDEQRNDYKKQYKDEI
jgi:hypothetical protein